MFQRIVNRVRAGGWMGNRSVVASGLTAAGTNNTNALVLSPDVDIHVIGTAAASTGVRLSAPGGVGDTVVVYNRGANAVLVYPQADGQINALTVTTAGLSVAAGSKAVLVCWDGTNWLSIVSA
jgi:hypothetical protein